MTLRLVLVSVVACVGLSLPSAERLERWTRCSHGWADGRTGSWEHGDLLDEGRFVIVADALEVGPSVPEAVATTGVTDTPKVIETAAAKPVYDEDSAAVTAAWLAAIEREAAPPANTAEDGGSDAQPTLELVAVDPIVQVAVFDAVEVERWQAWTDAMWALMLDDTRSDAAVAKPAPVVDTTADAASDDRAFAAIVEETVTAFTRDNEALAATARPAAPAPAAPTFEPMVIDDETHDVAYALNRASEGLTLSVPVTTKASEQRANRLSHAVRLTRDAVNAWASLLHGPALVTLGR